MLILWKTNGGCRKVAYILMGCLAFIFPLIFDINKIRFLNKYLNISFAIGIIILAFSTLGILISDFERFEINNIFRLLAGLVSTVSLLLMIYALFFALPFSKTYTDVEKKNLVIDTGMYALCRHPGVIWFAFFYLFLWIASGKMMMLWAGIAWTIMDIVHVYIQDNWFFPHTLEGYNTYKSRVPFLIPNRVSTRRYLSSCGIKNRKI